FSLLAASEFNETVALASASVVRRTVSEPCPPEFVAWVTPATVNCGSSKNSAAGTAGLAGAGVSEEAVWGRRERDQSSSFLFARGPRDRRWPYHIHSFPRAACKRRLGAMQSDTRLRNPCG